MGIFTWEPWPNCKLLNAAVSAGSPFPTATPMIMQRNTQTVR